jgi:hypothetical protein
VVHISGIMGEKKILPACELVMSASDMVTRRRFRFLLDELGLDSEMARDPRDGTTASAEAEL